MNLFESIHLLARWFHVIAGIIWIGHLYFFNFVNVPLQAALDDAGKKAVGPKLMPRALWWFRWGAMITFLAGPLVAVVGKVLIGGSHSIPGVVAEAMAAGSLLALVSHAMIPEALHQGGSMVVIPTVAGFVVALYLILLHALV